MFIHERTQGKEGTNEDRITHLRQPISPSADASAKAEKLCYPFHARILAQRRCYAKWKRFLSRRPFPHRERTRPQQPSQALLFAGMRRPAGRASRGKHRCERLTWDLQRIE